MENIIKRDGTKQKFDLEKIENAVAKAFISTSEVPARDVSALSRAVALIVLSSLNAAGKNTPSVEEIQDEVETALMKLGYPQTAKSYILY